MSLGQVLLTLALIAPEPPSLPFAHLLTFLQCLRFIIFKGQDVPKLLLPSAFEGGQYVPHDIMLVLEACFGSVCVVLGHMLSLPSRQPGAGACELRPCMAHEDVYLSIGLGESRPEHRSWAHGKAACSSGCRSSTAPVRHVMLILDDDDDDDEDDDDDDDEDDDEDDHESFMMSHGSSPGCDVYRRMQKQCAV
eukprot:5103428-Amphidinium_carterae.1